MSNEKKHTGGCHCGAVRFEAVVDATKGSRCNCSICAKVNGVGAIVKPDALVITKGESEVTPYEWGGKVSTRYFCKHCGVSVYQRGHLAELGGDYAGIYLNTLDDVDTAEIEMAYWDGRHDNWEAGPRDKPWPIRRAQA